MMQNAHPAPPPSSVDPSWKIGIVASAYHRDPVDALVAGATAALIEAGIPASHVTVHAAAGSFEIPLIGAALAHAHSVDALIGLGVIIRGETHHADLLATSVAHGMMDIQTRNCIPFAFEILYVDSLDQAVVRATGERNKGAEAAHAVLTSLATLQRIRA